VTQATQLSYDETVRALRGALAEAAGHARAFAVRARGRPQLVSTRTWGELAEIEALLAGAVETTLRRELRVEPWTLFVRGRTGARIIVESLRGERGLVRTLFEEARTHAVREWRQGAPQLEPTLWPFFVARSDYLANTFALALDEPAPHPPLLWHPGRREFTR
jgi:hypothetical protein